jgi:L-threonylcarbamoyladenylate synthase
MRTEILPADSDSIARAATVLRSGGLVAFPTETVYGLGANALDADAVARIFAAKGRPASNPVIVHIAGLMQVNQVVSEWPPIAEVLAKRFWPGPLTLVLPKRKEIPDIVTAGGATVAVRVPGHPVALALLQAAALPIAAPSANRSNKLSPTCAEHVATDLSGRVDLILDGGPTPGGIESTVIDLTSPVPRLLRPGLLQAADLEAVVGTLLQPEPSTPDPVLLSPGMLPRHYSPRTPLSCVEGGAEGRRARKLVSGLVLGGREIGYLCFADTPPTLPPGVVYRTLANEPLAAAAKLYEALHLLDGAGLDLIVVALPPDTAPWLAIRDRLLRAAASPLDEPDVDA